MTGLTFWGFEMSLLDFVSGLPKPEGWEVVVGDHRVSVQFSFTPVSLAGFISEDSTGARSVTKKNGSFLDLAKEVEKVNLESLDAFLGGLQKHPDYLCETGMMMPTSKDFRDLQKMWISSKSPSIQLFLGVDVFFMGVKNTQCGWNNKGYRVVLSDPMLHSRELEASRIFDKFGVRVKEFGGKTSKYRFSPSKFKKGNLKVTVGYNPENFTFFGEVIVAKGVEKEWELEEAFSWVFQFFLFIGGGDAVVESGWIFHLDTLNNFQRKWVRTIEVGIPQ